MSIIIINKKRGRIYFLLNEELLCQIESLIGIRVENRGRGRPR